MSSRFQMSDEPAFSNSYNWRTSAKLKLDESDEEINTTKKSLAKREIYDSSYGKSPVASRISSPLSRSVDAFLSSVGYGIDSNGIEDQTGRPKSSGFTSTGSKERVPERSASREETPTNTRRSNNEFTRSTNLGIYDSLPSSSYDYQNGRSETTLARKEDDRVKSRPPIAPGRPRPQPSDSLPMSGAPSTYNTHQDRAAASFTSNNKRALHGSINSLDNLRHADQQLLFDKHSTVRTTSSANFPSERPWSRSSDLGQFSQIQPASSLGTSSERSPPADVHESLLSGSRPRSALAGSLALRSGTPVNLRKSAGTPDLGYRDKGSSLRHSTDLKFGTTSYDEIIKRLRKMETQTSSGNLRMKLGVATDKDALESDSLTRGANVFKKKQTDAYPTKKPSDDFSDPYGLNDSSLYDRNLGIGKDTFQYRISMKPGLSVKAADVSNQSQPHLDLSNRTGERMSAYSKNGAIESWLRSVTNESNDLFTGQLQSDKSTVQHSNLSSSDHMEYKMSPKESRSTKTYDTFIEYDEKSRNERSRKLSNDSYKMATSPIKTQSVAKKGSMNFTDSMYDVDKPTHAIRSGFEPDLPVAKQERGRTDLSSYDPNKRSDSRLSLLRKYLDKADSVGAHTVSSAVDNGYLKLPDQLGIDDKRRSSSALDHRNPVLNTSHINGSSSRKMSPDLSYIGSSSNPVYTTTTLSRTLSKEALNDKDLYSGIASSRDKLNSYQTPSSSKRHDDPTLRSDRTFQTSEGYDFNALTSSLERPRSPTRNFAETFTSKGYDSTTHNTELKRLESETEAIRKDKYTTTSNNYDPTPSYSLTGQDWSSRSYGKTALNDAVKVEETTRKDLSGSQPTAGYADSRTLLSILEYNRKYKTASTDSSNQKPDAKHSSKTTRELAELSEKAKSEVDTTKDYFSKSIKDKTWTDNEPGHVRSTSDFSSLGTPKRVWYSEEHLAQSPGDPDNDISVRFDYKPDTYRYVLRKDDAGSAVDRMLVQNGVQERSAAATGVRKWRSDLALFGDNLEGKDPEATKFDSRNIREKFLRSSSFRDTKEPKTPERRQVTWRDEVVLDKASGDSSIAMNGNAMLLGNMLGRKESAAASSAMHFTPSIERLQPSERTRTAEDSLYDGLRSQSPSSRSFLASSWSASGREKDRESKLKRTVNGDANTSSLPETNSDYRPSDFKYESLRSQSPFAKTFLASTWTTSGDDDRETKLKQALNGDPNPTSLNESHSNYRPSDTTYESLRSQSPSSKSFLASAWSASGRDDRGKKLEQSANDDPNSTYLDESPSNYRPSGYTYDSLRSQSPTSKSITVSTWSASDRNEDLETKLKHTVIGSESNRTSLHETPSNYRKTYQPISRLLSSTSYTYSDHEPLTTKASNTALYDDDYNMTSTTNRAKPTPNHYSTDNRHAPTDDGVSTKTSTYLSTDSVYKSSYSPTRYTSSAPSTPQDTHNDDHTGNYTTPISAVKTDSGLYSSPYSSQGIKEFLARSSLSKSTRDFNEPDGVPAEKWRPVTVNGASTSGMSDSYDQFLSSCIYDGSTHKESNHLNSHPTSTSLLDSSARGASSTRGLYSSSKPNRSDDVSVPLTLDATFPRETGHLATTFPRETGHLATTFPRDTGHLATTFPRETGHLATTFPRETGHLATTFQRETGHLATTFPRETGHLASSLLSSTETYSLKDNSTTGLPYKYLTYANHVSPSSNCSNDNSAFGQSSTTLSSDPYSGIGHGLGLASSGRTSGEVLRNPRSDSLTNGYSRGVDFPSEVPDKHDDGLSLVSETEFVVMRSGDIVKRPFKKSDRSDTRSQSRHNKPESIRTQSFKMN